jgi:capsular exopolysaccharide synthesis family protein
MVTSPLSGDGKSMIAVNLAISFSFEGLNVLLVDADMRRSKGYGPLAHAAKGEGLVSWLEGGLGSPEDAVVESFIPNLSVLPAGGKAGNATKLVASPKMVDLFEWAQENFDVVVVDTPAVLPVADTTMFANLGRAMLMVVDAANTRSGAARAAISRLVHVRGRVVGAVLNRADHRALGYMSYYGAKYGYGYGYRYGYSSYS